MSIWPAEKPAGVILAGGLSRRMGGGNKALRVLAGRTLLSRVIERLAPQCGVPHTDLGTSRKAK